MIEQPQNPHDHGTDEDVDHAFDKEYWEQHWQDGCPEAPGSMHASPPNPHLVREVHDLKPGTALDAGCGAGSEAIWLAAAGWQVTAADISAEALSRAATRAEAQSLADSVTWIEADLSVWAPATQFDLVTTHYAHPSIPQLDFYDRIADWVAPGGTLLIVGHLHGHSHGGAHHDDAHSHHPPEEATATAATITARLDKSQWTVETADEVHRVAIRPDGEEMTLHDVIVRATRR